MRIVAIIFGILAAIVDLILVIVSIAVPEVSLWGWIVVLTIVTVGLFFQCEQGQEAEGSQTGGTSGQKHAVHGRKRDFSDRTGRTSCCNRDAGSFGRRRSRPLLRAGDEDRHEEQGCRPNRKRCWRPCPRCEGCVGKHWRRFQSDGLRRSDRNLFRRYRFNE